MKHIFKHPLLIPAAISMAILVSLGVFECLNTYYWTLPDSPDALIDEGLDTGEELFHQSEKSDI